MGIKHRWGTKDQDTLVPIMLMNHGLFLQGPPECMSNVTI